MRAPCGARPDDAPMRGYGPGGSEGPWTQLSQLVTQARSQAKLPTISLGVPALSDCDKSTNHAFPRPRMEWTFHAPLKFARQIAAPAPAKRVTTLDPPAAEDSSVPERNSAAPWAHLERAAWAKLRAAPYGLTTDSCVVSADAFAALLGALSGAVAPDDAYVVQSSSGVLVVCLGRESVVDAALPSSPGAGVVAWKRTVGQHRILILDALSPRGPRDLLDAFLAPPIQPAASTGLPPSPASVPLRLLCQLDALLSWLRTSVRVALLAEDSCVVGAVTAAPAEVAATAAEKRSATSLWSLRRAPSGGLFELSPRPSTAPLLSADVIGSLLMAAGPAPSGAAAAEGGQHRHTGPIQPGVQRAGGGAASTGVATGGGATSVAGKHARSEGGDTTIAEPSLPRPPPLASTGAGVSLAVIVPFRDQPLQNRGEQLRRFSESMPAFFRRAPHAVRDFHIIVVEQTDDG